MLENILRNIKYFTFSMSRWLKRWIIYFLFSESLTNLKEIALTKEERIYIIQLSGSSTTKNVTRTYKTLTECRFPETQCRKLSRNSKVQFVSLMQEDLENQR